MCFSRIIRRIKQYNLLLFEMSETLGTICLILSNDRYAGRHRNNLLSHANQLREYSEFLREVDNNGKR